MRKKKGDTLIEVALAIGIFSMVAMVVVSVISASTSAAQSALELTITREELDAQADALRFIHDSYVIGSQSADTSENPYADLWNALVARAVEASNAGLDDVPRACSELYEGNGFLKNSATRKQFVINTRKLSNPSDTAGIIVATSAATSTGPFYEAATYPRILYGGSGLGSSTTSEDLYSQVENASTTIQRVEGIYIIAVKGSSKIVAETGTSISDKNSYYDFYIHSCWMPPSSDYASTVSTVVRLYDPAVITY